MDLFLAITAGVLIVTGIVGCVLPGLPGSPIAYLGILCLHFSERYQFTLTQLIIFGLLVAVISVLDYIIPIYGTKRFGGTNKGAWGSAIGLVLGILITPVGMLLGAFLGAFIGELIGKMPYQKALWAALGSFIGLLTGTVLKLLVCCVMLGYYIYQLVVM